MAILSATEQASRTFSHKFGEAPNAERKFIVSSDITAPSHQAILDYIGIYHGAMHPEFEYLYCVDGTISEGTPTAYHAEVTYRYEVPKQGSESTPNPLSRPDVWSFSTGGAAIPALVYYDESDNQKPLVNSAYDFFEGAMTEESETRCTIAGNRASFPAGIATAITNRVNSDYFLGAAQHTWKCAGIGAQQAVEVVNGAEIKYWQVTVELVYRASGWSLMLPDIGYNYLEGGQKKRAYVLDPEPPYEKIPSSNPVALTSGGGIASPGTMPTILTRRVHRAVAFAPYFGTPPS